MQYYLQPIPAPSLLRKNPYSQSLCYDLPPPLPPAIKPPNPPPKLCRYPPSPNPATPRSPSGVLTSALMASQPVFEGLVGEEEGRGRGMCLGGGGEVVGGVGSGIEGVSAGRVMVASGSPMPSSSHRSSRWCSSALVVGLWSPASEQSHGFERLECDIPGLSSPCLSSSSLSSCSSTLPRRMGCSVPASGEIWTRYSSAFLPSLMRDSVVSRERFMA